MSDGGIRPTAVSLRDRAPKCRAASSIDKANDSITIDGGGYGLAKFHIAKPFLFLREVGGGFFAEIVQVEEDEVVFEAGAGIGHGVAALLASEDGEIFSTEASDDVCFARLKAENLGVGAGDEEKNEFIEIGETISFHVRFPVIGVALEN